MSVDKIGKDALEQAFYITQLPAGVVAGTSVPVAGSGSSGGGTIYGNSVANPNVTVVPAAARTVLSKIAAASLPSGTYNIDVIAGFGATPEGTTDFNMQLVVGGTNGATNSGGTDVTKLMVSGANDRRTFNFKYILDGTQDLAITTTTAGGSAGSVYLTQIIATRIGN